MSMSNTDINAKSATVLGVDLIGVELTSMDTQKTNDQSFSLLGESNEPSGFTTTSSNKCASETEVKKTIGEQCEAAKLRMREWINRSAGQHLRAMKK